MFRKWIGALAIVGSCSALADDYPARNIQAVVPWGAGGATDTVARSLGAIVEPLLGGKLVISNRPGGTGLIGTSHVLRQRADGYTLLFGAENPQLYPLLGLADFDYRALYPVNIIGQSLSVIAVHPDSPWQDLQSLLDYAKAHPGELRMGTVGAGGAPSTIQAMIRSVQEMEVREVSFGGDGPGISALMGNHIDFMHLGLGPTKSQLLSGRLKALAIIDDQRFAELPDVPAITEVLPGMKPYMPWGTFWGVYVRPDVPAPVRDRLVAAFRQAVGQPEFQKLLKGYGANPLNLQGDAAQAYLQRWQSITAWSMYRAGLTLARTPQSLEIPQP